VSREILRQSRPRTNIFEINEYHYCRCSSIVRLYTDSFVVTVGKRAIDSALSEQRVWNDLHSRSLSDAEWDSELKVIETECDRGILNARTDTFRRPWCRVMDGRVELGMPEIVRKRKRTVAVAGCGTIILLAAGWIANALKGYIRISTRNF
jgi:hypothetical protein